MALYLISYDIADKDKLEYGPLWKRLEEIGATKVLYSEWMLPENTDRAEAIYNQIADLTLQRSPISPGGHQGRKMG